MQVFWMISRFMAVNWSILENRLKLKPKKCAFNVTSGALIRKEVYTIIIAPTLRDLKALSQFVGQIWWHRQML